METKRDAEESRCISVLKNQQPLTKVPQKYKSEKNTQIQVSYADRHTVNSHMKNICPIHEYFKIDKTHLKLLKSESRKRGVLRKEDKLQFLTLEQVNEEETQSHKTRCEGGIWIWTRTNIDIAERKDLLPSG